MTRSNDNVMLKSRIYVILGCIYNVNKCNKPTYTVDKLVCF